MTTRAIAFHESVASDKLQELFGSDGPQLFSSSQATGCGKCRARFAIFFPDKSDPDNISYIRDLEVTIAEDCTNGKHSQEVRLTTTP